MGDLFPIMPFMEQLILDIERYCAQRVISPQKLLRLVINAKWSQWQDWKDGKASPTMKVGDRIRTYMRDNPPKAEPAELHGPKAHEIDTGLPASDSQEDAA